MFILQTFLALLLVLALAWTTLLALQRLSGRSGKRGGGGIQLLESVRLGEKRQVFVLEVRGRQFLVGATPQQLNLLAELGPGEEPEVEEEYARIPEREEIIRVVPRA